LWDLLFNEAALYTMKGTSENNYKTFPGVWAVSKTFA
jgi:hypothetical protein